MAPSGPREGGSVRVIPVKVKVASSWVPGACTTGIVLPQKLYVALYKYIVRSALCDVRCTRRTGSVACRWPGAGQPERLAGAAVETEASWVQMVQPAVLTFGAPPSPPGIFLQLTASSVLSLSLGLFCFIFPPIAPVCRDL
jgi:hypothetical protein